MTASAELRYGRDLSRRFSAQEQIDRRIAQLEAEQQARYGHITGAVESYFAEVAIDGCTDAGKLRAVLYELANQGVELRDSETFKSLLENVVAEELGLEG